MVGLEAISQNNGWIAAGTGACIVFCGLSALAFIISQLHRLIALLDHLPKRKVGVITKAKPAKPRLPENPTDPELTIIRYQPLIDELDQEFNLADLYALAKQYHLPHPHLSIRSLLIAGKLQPLGDGRCKSAHA